MKIPADLKGSWFFLFSHPADYTPVCTKEFVAFQKRFEEFEKLNCKLIGISIDQVFSHIKWGQWIEEKLDVEIKFPIIAANDTIANKLGMLHPSKGTNTIRAVFVGDPEGKVRLIFYYPQEVGRNMDEILRAVKALQVADKEGVALPAGWPDNELIEDRVHSVERRGGRCQLQDGIPLQHRSLLSPTKWLHQSVLPGRWNLCLDPRWL